MIWSAMVVGWSTAGNIPKWMFRLHENWLSVTWTSPRPIRLDAGNRIACLMSGKQIDAQTGCRNVAHEKGAWSGVMAIFSGSDVFIFYRCLGSQPFLFYVEDVKQAWPRSKGCMKSLFLHANSSLSITIYSTLGPLFARYCFRCQMYSILRFTAQWCQFWPTTIRWI